MYSHKILLFNIKGLLLTFLLFSSIQASAQNKEIHVLINNGEPTYSISLLANGLKNPGLNFSYEYPLAIRQWEEPKRKIKALYLDGNLGFYWDPYTSIVTFLSAGVLYRRTYKRNFQTTIGLNPLGIQHHFFHETYEVDDNLEVERKRFAGRSYYAPELVLGLGRLRKNKASFFNIRIAILAKYNLLGILPTMNFEYGYRF